MLYKDYDIQLKEYQQYKIVLLGKGGSIPAELEGAYTNRAAAMLAIGSYLDKKKVVKQDEGTSTRS